MVVVTSHRGNNANLIAEVASLYIPDNATVADVTYGKGAFWTKTDLTRFHLKGSDLKPLNEDVLCADFRNLPYADGSLDAVILDPPYIHNPGNHVTDTRYNNAETTKGLYNADIMKLYEAGMSEANRVLKSKGGQLWVKCKDEVESNTQRWSHIYLYEIAQRLGFYAKDLFVLTPDSNTTSNRWPGKQRHARKNHSYLWVFEKKGK